MKKILLNEAEKKAIISEREQAIIKNFAKTFNAIKRIDENELTEERPISARYGDDPSPEQSAGIDKFVKDFLDKKDKEKKSEIKSNDTKISGNELSEIGSMSNHEGNRGDDYKYDGSGNNEWVPFYDDIEAEGWSWDDESSTIGTKCCEYTVEFYQDNQYGLYRDNQYGHGHRGERLTKTALNIDELISLIHNIESANQLGENDGEDYEAASRGVEYGINPYQDQPDMGLGELTQDREQGKMSYPPKTQENEWPKIGDIVKFKDNLADSYGNKYLVVSKGHGRHGHGELIAVSGDYGKYDDDISNTIYRVSDVFKTVAKTNQSWFLDELKHDIEYSDGNLSVQKIIDSALSGDI